jgi:hypothetical protein
MKFRLTSEHTYPWPISVTVPDPDKPGEVIEQKFVMTFRAMPLDEAQKLDDELAALPAREQVLRQDDVLRRVAIGWNEDVVGDDNKPIPFSTEALEQAIQLSWFRLATYRGYRDSLLAQPKAGN